PQPIERLPSDDPHQVRTRVGHLGLTVSADRVPPRPRLLHCVLGIGRRAEQLVGDGEEQAAVRNERVVGHASERGAGVARGLRSHDCAYSSDSIPSATLPREFMLAMVMNAVRSTKAASPSCFSSSLTISSGTTGGVWVMASAYPSPARSCGVNTAESRQRGTSRALSISRCLLNAWK